MAPRALESRDAFITRLKQAAAAGQTQVRFGAHHFTHAACLEGGVWRVRRLEHTREEADAYLKEHGYFMPESAEAISRPRTLVFEAPTLEALVAEFEKRDFPW